MSFRTSSIGKAGLFAVLAAGVVIVAAMQRTSALDIHASVDPELNNGTTSSPGTNATYETLMSSDSRRINGGNVEYVRRTDNLPTLPATYTYTWTPITTNPGVGNYDTINLTGYGYVMGTGNTMAGAGNNLFTMNNTTSSVRSGAWIDVVGGVSAAPTTSLTRGVGLYAGTVVGDIRSSQSTDWLVRNKSATETISISGNLDADAASGANRFYLSSGAITGNVYGSSQSGATNYFRSGGGITSTGWLYGGGAASSSTTDLAGGIVRNITGDAKTTAPASLIADQFFADNVVNIVSGYTHGSGAAYSAGIMNNIRAKGASNHAYRYINLSNLNVRNNSVLEIGYYDGTDLAQLSSANVNVEAGGKFVINPSSDTAALNHVNEFDVWGVATINKTTLQKFSSNMNNALFNVRNGGVLHGFGAYTHVDGNFDHDAAAANSIGTLTLYAGSKLQPYDWDTFGVASMNENRTEDGTGDNGLDILKQVNYLHEGDLVFKSATSNAQTRASMLSTRVFDNTDWTLYTSENLQKVGALSDWITVDPGNAADDDLVNLIEIRTKVTTAQNQGLSEKDVNKYKVQYDPVFGFNYELVSKQKFNVARPSDPDINKNQYEFMILERTDGGVIQQNNETAESLFSRDIIKSDMLGLWNYEFRNDGKEVWVTYRMTAEHPSNGGLAIDATTPNSRNAAVVLDVWRYPFQTNYNSEYHSIVAADPSLGNGPNQTNAANHNNNELADYGAGYNGDMNDFYAGNQEKYGNYATYFISDFEHLLLNTQYDVGDTQKMEEFLRQVHGESFASMTGVNLRLMNGFIANRERNTMSALYQVEENLVRDVAIQADQGYANMVYPQEEEQYVCNPIRFWAAAFGQDGKQKRVGSEYGYKVDYYGGSLGAIKEFGDLYVGLTAGYADQTAKFDELVARNDSRAYLGELHAGYRFGMAFVEAHGNYGYVDQKMKRSINANNGQYRGETHADYSDRIFGGGVRLGYQHLFGNDKWLLVPTLGLTYMRTENNLFEEKGRYDLSVRMIFNKGDINRENYRVPLTLRLSRPFAIREFVIAPEIRAGYTQILGDKRGHTKQRYAGMPIPDVFFESVGVKDGDYEVQLGASLEISRRGRFYIAGNYDYSFHRKSHFHNFSLQAGLNF